jgi:hypothetical protein
MQHLRPARPHPGSLAGGEDQDVIRHPTCGASATVRSARGARQPRSTVTRRQSLKGDIWQQTARTS